MAEFSNIFVDFDEVSYLRLCLNFEAVICFFFTSLHILNFTAQNYISLL